MTAVERTDDRSRSPSRKSEGDDPVVASSFMKAAACSATCGVKLCHGGPFGACIVKGGNIISCAHNSVLLDKDPTCHAEMNAIKQACKALQSHDLSDCELYTTCEPCPMCWGAVQWSRLNKIYIGADRFTAAKYGFDDKVFYDEVEHHAEVFGLHRYGYMPDSNTEKSKGVQRQKKNMLEVHIGLMRRDCENLFMDEHVNKTYRRRKAGTLAKAMGDAFQSRPTTSGASSPENGKTSPGSPEPKFQLCGLPRMAPEEELQLIAAHENFMKRAIEAARLGAKAGTSKEREPFGAVLVHDGRVIAMESNTVLASRDATATAEVNAIRTATRILGTYNLEECTLYTTCVPDVMSMGACLWARIPVIYCGVPTDFTTRWCHEDHMMQFQELMDVSKENRNIPVTDNVARDACEEVFKFWSSLNGTIY
mmetsp:Transcript_15437/g.35252  ORF Transcript_15437/g.35252 Transcript_15437/m.35252 type:complete len:423 (+) Transcript_15437:74-1342(+)